MLLGLVTLLLPLFALGCASHLAVPIAITLGTDEGCVVEVGGRVLRGTAEDTRFLSTGSDSLSRTVSHESGCLLEGYDLQVQFPYVPATDAMLEEPPLPGGVYRVVRGTTSDPNVRLAERAQIRLLAPAEALTLDRDAWVGIDGAVVVERPHSARSPLHLRVDATVRRTRVRQ
jgi:hypothetical protein